MKYCRNCGEEIKNIGAKFCSGCGETLSTPTPPIDKTPTPEQTDTGAYHTPQQPTADAYHAHGQPTTDAYHTPQQTTTDPYHTPQQSATDPYHTHGQPTADPYHTPQQSATDPYHTHGQTTADAYHTHEQPPTQKDNTKKILIPILIGLPLLVVILIVVALIASGMFSSPVDRFRALQQDQIFNPIISLLEEEQEETEFSTDLIISASAVSSSRDPFARMATNLLEGLTLELSIDASLDPLEYLIGFSSNFLGEEILQGVITMDEEYFGFYFPDFASDYYIISFEALEEMAGGPGAGFDADFMSSFATPELTPENMASMVARHSEILLSHVHDDNLKVEREEVILFDGDEELNAQVYTFNPNPSDIRRILTDILEELSNEDIYYEIFSSTISSWDLEWSDYDTTAQYWESVLEDFRREIPELERTLGDDEGFIWRTAVYRNQIILQELSFEGNYFFRYESLQERSGERRDWFIIAEPDGNGRVLLTNEMTTSASEIEGRAEFFFDDGQRRRANLQQIFTLDYSFDPSTTSILDIPYGTYTLSFDDWLDDFTISLTVEAGDDGGTDHLFSVYDLEDLELESLTINLHSTDEPSQVQAPTRTPVDLSEMSDFEVMLLMMDLMREFESLFEMFDF